MLIIKMLPPEEFLIIDKTIKDNINLSFDEIIDLIGPLYYKVYTKEIDQMIYSAKIISQSKLF